MAKKKRDDFFAQGFSEKVFKKHVVTHCRIKHLLRTDLQNKKKSGNLVAVIKQENYFSET